MRFLYVLQKYLSLDIKEENLIQEVSQRSDRISDNNSSRFQRFIMIKKPSNLNTQSYLLT